MQTIKTESEVDISVFCSCGSSVDAEIVFKKRIGVYAVIVDVCVKCLKKEQSRRETELEDKVNELTWRLEDLESEK